MRPALYLYYHQNKKEERNLSKELKIRERDTQRQMDKNKIRRAKYNKKYKQLGGEWKETRAFRMGKIQKDKIRGKQGVNKGKMQKYAGR